MDFFTNATSTLASASAGGKKQGVFVAEIIAACQSSEMYLGNNVFVTLSFGRYTFKTKYSSQNPYTWRQKCFIPVDNTVLGYKATVALYKGNILFSNYFFGKAEFSLENFLMHPSVEINFSLQLSQPSDGANGSLAEFGDESASKNASASCIVLDAAAQKNQSLKAAAQPTNVKFILMKGKFVTWKENHYGNSLCTLLSRKILYEAFESREKDCFDAQTLAKMVSKQVLADGCVQREIIIVSSGRFHIDLLANFLAEMAIVPSANAGDCNVARIGVCHKCQKSTFKDEDSLLQHFIECTEIKTDGSFLTEEDASRKSIYRYLNKLSLGSYKLGIHEGHVLVQDRLTGKIVEEKIPFYLKMILKLLYRHGRPIVGRVMKKVFSTLTCKHGHKYDLPSSAKKIEGFVRYHQIKMGDFVVPQNGGYRTFNEFFYRKLKPGARRLQVDPAISVCVPADCRIVCFEDITSATSYWIKGRNFSIGSLLGDADRDEYYRGGSIVICRLAPQDYHRFHSPAAGRVVGVKYCHGEYYTVNPVAVREELDVLTENKRVLFYIDTEHFGQIAYVAVGATLVGSIRMTVDEGSVLNAMDEVGYFAFGGSTIVLLFRSNTVVLDRDLLTSSEEGIETLVQVGMSLGKLLNAS